MKRRFLYIAVLMAILATGCKKDMTQNQLLQPGNTSVQQAKNWYQNEISKTKSASRSTAGAIPLSNLSPEWYKSRRSIGGDALIIPVDSKQASGISVTRSLVVEQNEQGEVSKGYISYVLSKDEANTGITGAEDIPGDFSGAVINYSVDGNFISAIHYENGTTTDKQDNIVVKQHANNFAGGTAANNIEAPGCEDGMSVCIDWYWQSWENGVLVSEVYIGTTCRCYGGGSGGGGGGGGSNGEPTPEEMCMRQSQVFFDQGKVVSQLMSAVEVLQHDNIKVDDVSWKIYSAGTWGIVSFERLTWQRAAPNLAYVFSNYTSLGDSEIGASIGGTRTYHIVNKSAESHISSVVVKIIFAVKHQPICDLVNVVIPPVTLTHNANKNFKPANVVVVPQP